MRSKSTNVLNKMTHLCRSCCFVFLEKDFYLGSEDCFIWPNSWYSILLIVRESHFINPNIHIGRLIPLDVGLLLMDFSLENSCLCHYWLENWGSTKVDMFSHGWPCVLLPVCDHSLWDKPRICDLLIAVRDVKVSSKGLYAKTWHTHAEMRDAV